MNKQTQVCQVCEKEQSKYRCPSCKTRYCSVGCFKQHKESMCQPPFWSTKSNNQSQTTAAAAEAETANEEKGQETGDSYRVSEKQLKSLEANEALKRALGDPELQELLSKIDASGPDRERMLDEVMSSNEDFSAFVNAMLQTIGVRDLQGLCILR